MVSNILWYVVPMDLTQSLNCRQLRKYDVVDSTGEKIGRIGEMTFTFDKELKLSHFILVGSRWDAWVDWVDFFPIFNASHITKITDKIHLDTTANDLRIAIDDDVSEEHSLSNLEGMDIYDKEGLKVGNIIDIDFDVDGMASFTVGGGIIEETLEAIGLKADIDIIVPANTVESITDTVKLFVSKDDLQLTMDEALKRKTRDKVATDREHAKVRLYSHRRF